MRTYETVERPPGATIPAAPDILGVVLRYDVAQAIRQIGGVLRDALMLLAVVFSIPFVVVCIGLPIALLVQLLLWIGRLL
jgi:hypothetical protein